MPKRWLSVASRPEAQSKGWAGHARHIRPMAQQNGLGSAVARIAEEAHADGQGSGAMAAQLRSIQAIVVRPPKEEPTSFVSK